jgi:hypothetical protein
MITASELEAKLAAFPRACPVLALDGVLARDGETLEDDAWLAPALGLGIVAHGLGAIGHQGRPAAKLAVWSVVGELALRPEASLEERLRQGLARADAAVQRLSGNWPAGLVRPGATLTAVLLDGSDALVAHVGDCGVARLDADRLVPLTTPHVLGVEHPEAPPALARVLTRMLGAGTEPALQRIPVRPGDVLLLSTAPWPTAPVLDPRDPEALAAALVHRGATTVIAARIDERATRAPTRGSSRPPALPWLFAPGRPLAEPPERYAPNTTGQGPDARWFAEVFDGVMR